MRCLSCGFENPEGMRFCNECGAPLKGRCPQCGLENPPRSKFCGECGAPLSTPSPASRPQPPAPPAQAPIHYTPPHLAERILAEQSAMEARGASDGERKTITALFADIKGSMELMEARSLIDPALQLMMEAFHRYDGYVAQALGDGIFALFGAPIAHEDHPQRALYAALRMQEEMRHYSDTLRRKGHAPLLMRIGVNTGEVVVRSIRKDDLHADYIPVGHSTNLAARMEQLAAPGAILVTEQTHKLTQGYFELKPLGPTRLKGVEEPLHVYEVLGVGPLRTKLQVAARRGLTRFVGRQSELEQMRRALEQAQAGHGQIVGVMGEPGVGKSRLFYEFKLTSQSGSLLLETFSISHGKAFAYLPLIELLKNYLEIAPQDDGRRVREKVTGKVLALDRELSHPFSLIDALNYAALLQSLLREKQVTQTRAEAMIALSIEQGVPTFLAWGTILRGWAMAEQGQGEEGIAQMCQGLAAWQTTGGEQLRPYFLALLAEAYGKGGQVQEGLGAIDEALAAVQKSGERFSEAELVRLKGELLLSLSAKNEAEAEACFHQALEIARRQSARSWELRAMMSLSCLLQRQGKNEEARQRLAEIYGWFTEGFDTPDLQEAKALLEEMS